MNDLGEFLLARIAGDEAMARAAFPSPWEYVGRRQLGYESASGEPVASVRVRRGDFEDSCEGIWVRRDLRGDTAKHIARWDPARVLAECEIKREIIALHEQEPATRGDTGCRTCNYDGDRDQLNVGDGPCSTLRLLALAYAYHVDYRDEWR